MYQREMCSDYQRLCVCLSVRLFVCLSGDAILHYCMYFHMTLGNVLWVQLCSLK